MADYRIVDALEERLMDIMWMHLMKDSWILRIWQIIALWRRHCEEDLGHLSNCIRDNFQHS